MGPYRSLQIVQHKRSPLNLILSFSFFLFYNFERGDASIARHGISYYLLLPLFLLFLHLPHFILIWWLAFDHLIPHPIPPLHFCRGDTDHEDETRIMKMMIKYRKCHVPLLIASVIHLLGVPQIECLSIVLRIWSITKSENLNNVKCSLSNFHMCQINMCYQQWHWLGKEEVGNQYPIQCSFPFVHIHPCSLVY